MKKFHYQTHNREKCRAIARRKERRILKENQKIASSIIEMEQISCVKLTWWRRLLRLFFGE
jgi:cob(I)alamin adenosyltransferase